jgi:Ig-like domain-containing protein/HEAT repeat protein
MSGAQLSHLRSLAIGALAVLTTLVGPVVLRAAISHAQPPLTPRLMADSASFVADVTIPDGTAMNAGQNFVKTWRIRNSGSTTWSGYRLEFVGGAQMGASPSVSVPTTPPGATVDISVRMTAPAEVSIHRGRWRLLTPDRRELRVVTVVIRVYVATPSVGEPRFEGRTFTEWESDLTDHSPSVRTKAVQELSNFGPQAVPALIRTFRADPDENVRILALAASLDIRPLAVDTVRAILSAVADPSDTISTPALMAIFDAPPSSGFVSKDAVPALVDGLRDPNVKTRLTAIALLASLGPLARDAAPALRDLASLDPDPAVRDGASEVLTLIDAK